MRKNLLFQTSRTYQIPRFLFFLFFSLFISLNTHGQTDAYAPTVTSDKDDYAPGEVATITGTGWTQDQLVHVEFKEEPDYPDYHVYDVEVDANGNWEIKYNIEQRHLWVTFTVTAVGQQSSARATTVFTDGITSVAITSPTTASPLTVAKSSLPRSITINFNYSVTNKNDDVVVDVLLPEGGIGQVKTILKKDFNTGDNTSSISLTLPASFIAKSYSIVLTLHQGTTNLSTIQSNALIVNIPNTPPTVSIITKTGNEDNDINFSSSDFTSAFSDADGNSLNKIRISLLPANGVLKLSGTPVTINQEIAASSLGNLTFTPTANYVGNASFAWNGSDGTTYANNPASIFITINPVNDAPSFTKGPNQIINEDAGAQTINGWLPSFSAGPSNEFSQSINFIVSNSNSNLFSAQPAVAPNGTLSFTPAANAFGSATVSVKIKDNGGTVNGGVDESAEQTFTITVNSVNDAPSFNKGPNQIVNEDAGAQTVTWATAIMAGPANESGQTVNFMVTNNNNGLFSAQPSIADNGTLTYTPAANASGLATVNVKLKDNGGTDNKGVDESTVQTFVITVNSVNDAPSFTKGTDETVNEDSGDQTVTEWATAISKGAANESIQSIVFMVSNNNNSLFYTQPAINSNGTLFYTPAANASGVATVRVMLKDNGGTSIGGQDESAVQTFTITVKPVNDAPSFNITANPATVNEDAGLQTINSFAINLNDGDPEENQPFTFVTTSNSNEDLFAVAPAVSPFGTLTYTPAADANGSAVIKIVLKDNGPDGNPHENTSAEKTFTITVNAVNDAPRFTKGGNETVNEDAGARTISGWATAISNGAANESEQTLDFIVSNSGNGLFSVQPSIADNGTLTYTPAPNANGVATVSVRLKDDGGTANGGDNESTEQTFTITVNPVNDAPTFSKGDNQTVNEDDEAQSVAGWAAGISAGPSDEAGQILTFEVSNNNPSLFSTQPTITNYGTLNYTPAANAHGSATVTVSLIDNGGTDNGGDDESAVQTFTITVTAVNDAPEVATAIDDVEVNEDATNTVIDLSSTFSDVDGDALAIAVDNSNTALLTATYDVATKKLTLNYAADKNGSANLTVKATDGPASVEEKFAVKVNAVNDAPSFTIADDPAPVNEDAPAQSVSSFVTAINDGDDELTQTLTFQVTNNNNPTLFSEAPVIDATGKLTYTPAANANGSATITVTLSDNGLNAAPNVNTSAVKTFTITVNAVNDAPSFVKGANQTVNEDAAAQSVSGWATALSAGPANESTQTLSFTATNNNNNLFSAQPAIDATGKLTYTPAANANGAAIVSVKVIDNGGTANNGVDESAVQTFTITVNAVNDAPVVANNLSTQQVQYSDAIAPVTITGTDVDNNFSELTATASWKSTSATTFTSGLATTGLILTKGTATWSLAGNVLLAPGTYTIRVTVNDGTTNSSNNTGNTEFTIIIKPEDARATYTGAVFASTSSATSSTANVTLSATIQDITATADASGDNLFGDIRNAKVTFINRDNGVILVSNVSVGLVSSGDTKTGTATVNVSLSTGNANSATFTIGIIVTNYYDRASSDDNTVVTISKPLSDFITGGGYNTLTNSVGLINPKQGTKNNFGFNVKYNKSGTNLQGNINTIVRGVDGKVYQVKGNVMSSLAVDISKTSAHPYPTAVFNGKANIQDITNPLVPISVDGNATLQVTMTDAGEPGTADKIAITVWNKAGGLWFASNWSGTKTLEQLIAKGNLKVSSNNSFGTTTTNFTTKRITSAPEVARTTEQPTFQSNPNPFREQATIEFSLPQDETYNLEVYDMRGVLIKHLQSGQAKAGNLMQVNWNDPLIPTGVYIIRLSTSTGVQTLKIARE